MKTCRRCGKHLALSAFAPNKKIGRLNVCRSCIRQQVAAKHDNPFDVSEWMNLWNRTVPPTQGEQNGQKPR
jgi:hypothetical protein